MFFLHTQVNPPVSYGRIAGSILEKLVSLAARVDFVCDQYISPSIKDVERERRGTVETLYTITGCDQTELQDW